MTNVFRSFAKTCAMMLVILPSLTSAQESSSTVSTPIPTRPPWGISYFGDFAGSSLDHMDAFQADTRSRKKFSDRPISLYNEMTPSYFLNSGFKIYTKMMWTMEPQLNDKIGGFEMLDPKIGISKGSVLRTENLNIYANLSTIVPVTEYARNKGYTFTPASFQVTTYQFTSSLSYRSLSQVGFKFYNNEVPGKSKEKYKLEFAPALVYRINDKWDSEVFYTYEGKNFSDKKWSALKTAESGAGVGFSWRPIRQLKINPQLRIRKLEAINTKNTDFGILFFGDIL